MSFSSTPLRATDAMPELVRRVALILAALAGLVAARFLRRPHLAGLIVPLWHRLQRVAPRLGRVMARPAVMRARPVRVATAMATRPAGVRLPNGRGWLVRELGYEAVAVRSQLEALLNEPAMRAALAAAPAAGRVLRPVFRMLGLADLTVTTDAGAARGGARPEGSAAPDRDRNAGDAVASGAGVGGKTALA